MNLLKIFFISIFVIAIDQSIKTFFIAYLRNQEGYFLYINDFLSFVYTWNHGISFGFFNNYKYSNIVFIILNLLIIIYIIYITLKSNLIEFYGYSVIVGGALGNLIDRIIHGAVFDFISINFFLYHFPIFNVADVAITMGGALILLNMMLIKLNKN